MREKLEKLAQRHTKLGNSVQASILALWRACRDSEEVRAHTRDVQYNLDRALEMVQKCSEDLDKLIEA